MRQKMKLLVVSLLIAMFVAPNFGPALRAQAAGVPTAEELDQLLAPVALYPDSLLLQITTASTNPAGQACKPGSACAESSTGSGTGETVAFESPCWRPASTAEARRTRESPAT